MKLSVMLPMEEVYNDISKDSLVCGKMEKGGAYHDVDAKSFICC
jgi:hypothetical protein